MYNVSRCEIENSKSEKKPSVISAKTPQGYEPRPVYQECLPPVSFAFLCSVRETGKKQNLEKQTCSPSKRKPCETIGRAVMSFLQLVFFPCNAYINLTYLWPGRVKTDGLTPHPTPLCSKTCHTTLFRMICITHVIQPIPKHTIASYLYKHCLKLLSENVFYFSGCNVESHTFWKANWFPWFLEDVTECKFKYTPTPHPSYHHFRNGPRFKMERSILINTDVTT